MSVWLDKICADLPVRRRPVRGLVLAVAVTVASGAGADDTEVFFGQESAQANVLFVLDVSGSMRRMDDGPTSRLDRVKAALTELLSTTSDINVGLLSYTARGNYLHQEIKPVTENRDEVLASTESLVAGGSTPTVGALLEAAQYFRGETLASMSQAYESPMRSSCQSNHIVLLTDGQPTVSHVAEAQSVIYPGGGTACTTVDPVDGTCGTELASWLSTTDHSPSVGEMQSITTHTIGFAFTSDWLPGVSEAGGGQHFNADSASELLAAFDSILEVATDSNNSFAAPAITVDQMTRLSHREDMYLALFEPGNRMQWNGNLKRYLFDGKVRDKNNNTAINLDTGAIESNAHSFWSDAADGAAVPSGGAANELDADNRNVYTYTGTGDKHLSSAVNRIHESNSELTAAMLAVSDAEKNNLVMWARGVDVDNEYPGQTRTHMGDPLHSRPVILTYSGASDNVDSVVFVGTNEGFLHSINSSDGAEVFSFVPPELLQNLDHYYENERTRNRIYGLDGDLTLWVKDSGNDGIATIDGDHAYLYMGMRRGGRNYTALDVSVKDKPVYMWSINGDDAGFEKLGQSWSKPTVGKVAIDGVHTDVLIFGGGYDPLQDIASLRSSDTIGNDLFIVDATTGELLWNTAMDQDSYQAMEYSIPSDPSVLDVDGDGLIDQIYVGDMGGQVWRFDIDNGANANHPEVSGGVIANLSGASAADNRKFFYRPDVAIVHDGTEQFLAVSIGSGNRANPLNTSVDDHFYMIRQHSLFEAPAGYGIVDPLRSHSSNIVYRPINEGDLYNATANLIDHTNAAQAADANDELSSSAGWHIELTGGGEKVLAPSLTLNNSTVFTTYMPEQANIDCSPATGGGRVYTINVLDGTPVNGTEPEDRYTLLHSSGIPAEPAAHIDEDGNLHVLIGYEEVAMPSVTVVKRVYWAEQPDY